jgi:hypothetical protein
MKRRLGLLMLVVLGAYGCGGKRIATYPESPEPDMSAVMAIVGRFGIGSACPIGPDLVVTAAHMGDLRPFDATVGLYPYPWSSDDGQTGIIVPVRVVTVADLALYAPVDSLDRFYPRAERAPEAGETVWWQEYNFDSKDRAFEREVKKSRVLRVISGHIILREEVEGGASGSCVINGRGEVVGVVAFGKPLTHLAGEVAGVPAIFGDWLDAQSRADARMKEIMEQRREMETTQPVQWIPWP